MIVVEVNIRIMKKKVRKYKKFDYEAEKKMRDEMLTNLVNMINDDEMKMSSCEIRVRLLNAIE